MPSAKAVLVALVVLGAAIYLSFSDYVSLQSSTTVEQFRGLLGDQDTRASMAAGFDLLFAATYALLGVIAFAAVSAGLPRLIGTVAIIGSAIADEVENTMVLVNIRSGLDIDQSAVDLMTTAGAVKWGLLITAVVLFLALAGHRWLEQRRA